MSDDNALRAMTARATMMEGHRDFLQPEVERLTEQLAAAQAERDEAREALAEVRSNRNAYRGMATYRGERMVEMLRDKLDAEEALRADRGRTWEAWYCAHSWRTEAEDLEAERDAARADLSAAEERAAAWCGKYLARGLNLTQTRADLERLAPVVEAAWQVYGRPHSMHCAQGLPHPWPAPCPHCEALHRMFAALAALPASPAPSVPVEPPDGYALGEGWAAAAAESIADYLHEQGLEGMWPEAQGTRQRIIENALRRANEPPPVAPVADQPMGCKTCGEFGPDLRPRWSDGAMFCSEHWASPAPAGHEAEAQARRQLAGETVTTSGKGTFAKANGVPWREPRFDGSVLFQHTGGPREREAVERMMRKPAPVEPPAPAEPVAPKPACDTCNDTGFVNIATPSCPHCEAGLDDEPLADSPAPVEAVGPVACGVCGGDGTLETSVGLRMCGDCSGTGKGEGR